jgi:hypothetical protein
MTAYASHPTADLFPPIEGDDLNALVADITANDLLGPIKLYDVRVVDGRNRLAADIAP